jgi:hypothetical protein
MKTWSHLFTGLFLFVLPSSVLADTDSMLWTSAGVKVELPHEFEVGYVQNVRWDQGMSQLESILPEAVVEFEPLSWLSLGTVYRYNAERSKSGDLEYGHRVLMVAGAEHEWGSIELSYRLGYQIKNELDEEELDKRIRNRIGLKYDTDTAFTPYTAIELYTEPDAPSWVHKKYRVTAGGAAEIIDNHRFKIGYRMQSEMDDGDDGDVEHILLLAYTFKFSAIKDQ